MSRMPWRVGELAELSQEVGGGGDESALAQDRLDDHGRDTTRRDLRVEQALERCDGALGVPAAVLVWERRLVDLGRVGTEVLLVGADRPGEAEGEQRPAVEAAAEADHRRAAGCRTGDLDRVLHGLSACAEEDRFLLTFERRHLAQALGQAQVRLVHHDLEGGVGGALELGPDGFHDAGVGVADVHHADAPDEVDEPATVDVPELGALGMLGDQGMGGADASRDVLRAKFGELRLERLLLHPHGAIQADTIRDCGGGRRCRRAAVARTAGGGDSARRRHHEPQLQSRGRRGCLRASDGRRQDGAFGHRPGGRARRQPACGGDRDRAAGGGFRRFRGVAGDAVS